MQKKAVLNCKGLQATLSQNVVNFGGHERLRFSGSFLPNFCKFLDGQTDRSAVAITAVCIASNADAL